MTELQQKPKYRPEPARESQDQLINFELTQQNTLTSWNQKINKQQFRSKTPVMNLQNDDDLVYSDNQNEQDHHEEILSKQYSLPNKNIKDEKIFADRINVTVDTRIKKKQNQAEDQESEMKGSWFKSQNSRRKTDEGEKRIKQNKSSCLLHNKSVFFTNNIKPISSTIVFRVKPRPDIKQLAENAMKSERKNN